jgi:hypothetical protein
VVAIEYMPAAIKELGCDASAMLDWFSGREFRMYSLRKDGPPSVEVSGLEPWIAAIGN